MRGRDRVMQSLDNVYRGAFSAADKAGDSDTMARLDIEYQRDQLQLEVLLDIRELLVPEEKDTTTTLLEKAQQIRKLTKLR